MFGISLGLFSPSHTTEQKLLHFFVRLPFSPSSSCFLFFRLFFFFITLSQPSVFLQQSNTHDNLIVCRCSFNTKPWWGALQSGKAEGISVCVRAPSFTTTVPPPLCSWSLGPLCFCFWTRRTTEMWVFLPLSARLSLIIAPCPLRLIGPSRPLRDFVVRYTFNACWHSGSVASLFVLSQHQSALVKSPPIATVIVFRYQHQTSKMN